MQFDLLRHVHDEGPPFLGDEWRDFLRMQMGMYAHEQPTAVYVLNSLQASLSPGEGGWQSQSHPGVLLFSACLGTTFPCSPFHN